MDSEKTKRIYLAGPFFSEAEIRNIEYAESVLRRRGFPFFSPMRYEAKEEAGTTAWAGEVFEKDRAELLRADAVVALYYGSSGDTGTAWECGYAAALGKPVVLVHVLRDGDSNVMMHCGCRTNIPLEALETYDFDGMPVFEFRGRMY